VLLPLPKIEPTAKRFPVMVGITGKVNIGVGEEVAGKISVTGDGNLIRGEKIDIGRGIDIYRFEFSVLGKEKRRKRKNNSK